MGQAGEATIEEAASDIFWKEKLCGGLPGIAHGQEEVLRDGVLDFLPWLDQIAASPHDPAQWIEDGITLGRGAFGIVARGMNQQTGELVAIKRIPPTHALAAQTAVNEFEAAQILGEHPNIVQLKAFYLSTEVHDGKPMGGQVKLNAYRDVVLVYRLALGGSLEEWIEQQHGSSFSVNYGQPRLTDEAVRIMRELVRGLMHIHSKNVQHRDLKPANILLSAGGTALIADFGIALANRSSTRVRGHSALGDFYFTDVDSLVSKGLPYTLDDDIFSLAENFVRILYGKHGTGSELQRFVAGLDERGEPCPQIFRILDGMLKPREERWALKDVQAELNVLRGGPLPSEPRPIVTEIFLGVGALITAAAVAEHLRLRRLRRQRICRSKLKAAVRVCARQNGRVEMQDFYCHARVRWGLLSGSRAWRLLGVFDGHGGRSCAKFAARFLPHEMRRKLRDAEASSEVLAMAEDMKHETSGKGEGVSLGVMRIAAQALREALESLNELFVGFKERHGEQNLTGTTASVALISPDARSVVMCNIGDSCTALIGDWEVEEVMGNAPQTLPQLVVSSPHSTSDAAEIARIEAAGGFVEYGAHGHRVNGVLGVSRAVGYAGVPDFADVVPALSDTCIARRQGDGTAVVAMATDALFVKHTAEEVFRPLADAQSAADLDQHVGTQCSAECLDKDNATLLACMLPGADAGEQYVG